MLTGDGSALGFFSTEAPNCRDARLQRLKASELLEAILDQSCSRLQGCLNPGVLERIQCQGLHALKGREQSRFHKEAEADVALTLRANTTPKS